MVERTDTLEDLSKYAVLKDENNKISECINKIMNTLSFRKLAGKTQVILSLTGPDVRTRLTHTIEVARIARDICKALKLNENLAEAIAIAHDIGHTPFGHVGERTLREIMCGCDTLNNKIRDYDYFNSGFKHNLQSFRVLEHFEQVINIHKEIWPYILWGAVSHSKFSWAKPESGLEDEILISSKHCDLVYVCDYHEKKECKRNIQIKKEKSPGQKEICKPWYCANLPVITDSKDIKEDMKNPDETTREFIEKEVISREYQKHIFCSRKCYLAKLWKFKIEKSPISIAHPYLFDHPFPNSFYSKSLNNYFYDRSNNKRSKGFYSLEAIIVSRADEIAQRQQDLEDGINKGLLTFKEARDQVKDMIQHFKDEDNLKELYDYVKKAKNPDELGKLLVEFYRKLICIGTKKNFQKFESDFERETINIYCLLNLIYSIQNDPKKQLKWIIKQLQEIRNGSLSVDDFKNSSVSNYFNLNLSPAYLFLLIYIYLENCTKQYNYTKDTLRILNESINSLEFEFCNHNVEDEFKNMKSQINQLNESLLILNNIYKKSDVYKIAYHFIRILDLFHAFLRIFYKDEFDDFFRKEPKEWWKNIGALNLYHFFVLYSIYERYFLGKNNIFFVKDLVRFKWNIKKGEYNPEPVLIVWKNILKREANRVVDNLIKFIFIDDPAWKKKSDALQHFEEIQKNTILKSEIVEKNDGKARYILTRLFKAYISNPHQLPDTGLKYIIMTLIESGIWNQMIDSEEKTFSGIIEKLKKTMVDSDEKKKKLDEILKQDFFEIAPKCGEINFKKIKQGVSNEIKAALENRRRLYFFFRELKNKKGEIKKCLISEEDKHIRLLKDILRLFRANLDNSLLNPTPFWKSILTRGICDYIANLTDQEAINEYEKLYAGIMELV